MDKSPIFAVKAAVIYKSQLVWVETPWKKKGWKMDHYQRKLKNDIKENLLKNIELTYDSINFINYPLKEKNELMQTLQLKFITHLLR